MAGCKIHQLFGDFQAARHVPRTNGHDEAEPMKLGATDSIYVWPIFCKFQGIYPPNMVLYGTNVPPSVGSWNSHWIEESSTERTCLMETHQLIWYLVGGATTILKNMKVNGKDYPIYYGKKCLKPPTSKSESKALYIASKCPSVGKCRFFPRWNWVFPDGINLKPLFGGIPKVGMAQVAGCAHPKRRLVRFWFSHHSAPPYACEETHLRQPPHS